MLCKRYISIVALHESIDILDSIIEIGDFAFEEYRNIERKSFQTPCIR